MQRRHLRAGAVVILVAMAVAWVALAAAMHLYPGGNLGDRRCAHHSFWLNFLCDLTGDPALNGAPNPGAAFARVAIVALAVSLAAFWLVLPALFPRAPRAGTVVRWSGTLAALGLLVVPTAGGFLHAVAVYAASGPGLVAAVTAFVAIARDARDRVLTGAAAGAIAAGLVDLVLYSRHVARDFQGCPPALPAMQRVAFLFMLAWILTAAFRLLGRGSRPGRAQDEPSSV